MNYFETLFILHTHWNFSWDEINEMYPFELDFVIMQIMIEKDKKKRGKNEFMEAIGDLIQNDPSD